MFLEIISPVQCCFRAVFFWNRAVSELFRAVFLWFSAVQRWSKFVTFWSERVKKTLVNTTFALFSVHFTQNPIFQPFYQVTCDQEAWGRGGCVNSNFWLEFRRNDFFIAGTLQKNMFFVIPLPFRTHTKHFRRFFDSFWSSAEQRWFRENQRWNSADQRWFS